MTGRPDVPFGAMTVRFGRERVPVAVNQLGWCGIGPRVVLIDSGGYMKTILLASTFLFAVAGSALAADAVVYEPTPEIPPAAFVWTGGYVGLQAGYSWGDSALGFTPNTVTSNPKPDGVLGGVYVGYNAQLSNKIVLGVEGDFVFASLDDNDRVYDSGSPIGSQSLNVDVNWTAAVRGRLGYAVERFLPYIAAGIAFADVGHEGFLSPGESAGGGSDTFVGWTVGIGTEYAFAANLVGRAEYRYTDFGSEDYARLPMFRAHTIDLKTHDIRVGIAYKF